MKLRDRMIYAGIVTSDMKRRHKVHVREFYRDLLHCCDDHGRFESDPALLRAVLYASILDRVSVRDVQGYLQTLHVAGDIKLYTVRGKAYGKVTKWRQTRLTKLVAEYPPEDGDPELPLEASAAPPSAPPKPKERKKEVSAPARETRGTHSTVQISEEEWLAKLAGQFPHIDVRAELNACLRKYPHAGRKFFEDSWLTNWEPPMKRHEEDAAEPLPEPEGFVAWFTERYEKAPTKPWGDMTRESQAYYAKLIGQPAFALPR